MPRAMRFSPKHHGTFTPLRHTESIGMDYQRDIHEHDAGRPDIRRRMRTSRNAAEYSLVVLLDALRSKHIPFRDSTIVLVGFPKAHDEETRNARIIRETLHKQGARIRHFMPAEHADVTPRSLDDALQGATAAMIATDSRAFRLVSRKDFRSRGIDVVIPTDLREE